MTRSSELLWAEELGYSTHNNTQSRGDQKPKAFRCQTRQYRDQEEEENSLKLQRLIGDKVNHRKVNQAVEQLDWKLR
jgi:hypothetical protein